ncbi:hypothetical protein Tco_0658067 [Tanacetum coccineum]
MTISELKAKLISVEKGKNVDTKFDRFAVLRKLICVRPMNKNKDLKSKIVPKIEVRKDLLKQVTSCSSPKIEQVKRVESSSSVSRPESKSTNLKKSVFLNTKSKRTTKEFKKHQNSGSFVSNKSDTSNLNVSTPKVNVLNAKVVNVVNNDNEAPQIVSTSEERITDKPTTRVLDDIANELIQEDIAKLDENTFINLFCSLVLEEAESSSTNQDPSNMHEFYQQHRSTDQCTSMSTTKSEYISLSACYA